MFDVLHTMVDLRCVTIAAGILLVFVSLMVLGEGLGRLMGEL